MSCFIALRNNGRSFFSPIKLAFSFTRVYSDNVFQRYKEKLEKKAKEKGFSSIEELKKNFEDKKKSKNEVEKDVEIKIKKGIRFDSTGKYKRLESYIDIEKVKTLLTNEIEKVWRLRFNKTNHFSAVLTKDQYTKLSINSFKYPAFVLPLKKDDNSYEIYFLQWQVIGSKTLYCFLTPLNEYKRHLDFSRLHFILMFHSDLAETKKIILMNGIVDENSNLSVSDAHILFLNLQKFYGEFTDVERSIKRMKLLSDFKIGSNDFKIDDLINESIFI